MKNSILLREFFFVVEFKEKKKEYLFLVWPYKPFSSGLPWPDDDDDNDDDGNDDGDGDNDLLEYITTKKLLTIFHTDQS
jgi:hypothetical protein